MSDPPQQGANHPDDSDVDELPSDFTPPRPAGDRSLEDELAALSSLEEEDADGEPEEKK